jgi:hypothetical protein
MCGQKCDSSKLNQFVNKKVQLSFSPNITYSYQRFNWKFEDNELILFDESEESETYISNIIQMTNISEDMYKDVISINFNDNQMIDICCLESRPVLPRCNYCGEIIHEYEGFFELDTQCGYGSRYDSERINLKMHWQCFDLAFANLISKEDSSND